MCTDIHRRARKRCVGAWRDRQVCLGLSGNRLCVYVCVYVCVSMCYMYVHRYAEDALESDAVVVFSGCIYGYVCLFAFMYVCMRVHRYAGDALENVAIAV